MCNLVIKLQVSFQFPWRRSQWPLQEQQQGSLQGQTAAGAFAPAVHQVGPTQIHPADASLQQQPALQPACSHNPGGSASVRPDLSSAAQQRSAEAEEEASQQPATGHWRHHAYSMAAAPSHQQRLGPHWQRWSHDGGGAAQLPHQDACSLPSLDAESASTGHEGHRQAPVTRPSSLWGFAASGVDLSQHPAASEQAELQQLTWQGPAQLGQAGASPDDDSLIAPDSLSPAMPLSHPKSASHSRASGQESTSGGRENKQHGAQQAAQDEEDQWMLVDHDGRREQQGRWAPAKRVRHMMTRARRHRAERRSRHGNISAQTNLADTASASAST